MVVAMSEEIIEEFNPWTRAITSAEAAMILLLFFWIICAVLRFFDKISEQMFFDLVLTSGIVTPLLRKIKD